MRKLLIITCLLIPLTVLAQSTAEDYWRQAQAAEKKENYSLAINLYKQCKSATEDKFFKEDCDNKIKALKQLASRPYLTVPDSVIIPYTGEFQRVTINSNPKNWSYKVIAGQLRDVKKDGNQLLVVSQATNRSMEPTTATIRITAGTISKNIQVIQEASPEFLHCSSKELTPSSKGEKYEIDVDANYENWTFSSDTTWFKTHKIGDKLIIEIAPNNMVSDRADSVVVKGKDLSVTIIINQRASDEKLSFSQNSLWFPVDGESRTIAVYTNADHWFVGNSPEWCHVEKISQDSLRITTFRNTSDNIPNEASVYITTGLQSLPIRIYQDAEPFTPPFVTTLEGRSVSFGLSVAYTQPFVLASAGSDYVGSVVNYGLGTSDENAVYTSARGVNCGIFADIRLYKNFYLIAGMNYQFYTYANSFKQPTEIRDPHTDNTYVQGIVQNSYKEIYTHHIIEVPLLASYRFRIKEKQNLQLNIGPVLNYGLSAKVQVSGNTSSEDLSLYNVRTNKKVGEGYVRHFSYDAEMNLYENEVNWLLHSTTHNNIPISLYDSFSDAPLKRLNLGIQFGTVYEYYGLSFGLYYTAMLTNMANNGYWEGRRWYLDSQGQNVMSGYKQQIHTLQFRLAYAFRYTHKKK